ncbi:MAG TPA: hypothetical protein VMV10_25180 [Pirellulales bacterium]|nr:hypothetical protein [Pirellulales bacterium]
MAALEELGLTTHYRKGDESPSIDPEEAADREKGAESLQTLADWALWATPRSLRPALGIDFYYSADSVSSDAEGDLAPAAGHLRDLPDLRTLVLDRVLDEDFAAIDALKNLKNLFISDAYISDASLVHIGKLQGLERLGINAARFLPPRGKSALEPRWARPAITDAGLVRLAKLRRLTHLNLSGSAVTGPGLVHLAGASKLEVLDLSKSSITDDGLVHVAKLRQLKQLDLSDTAIGDAGLSHLANFTQLEILHLDRTLVTDAGLVQLARLRRLAVLFLGNSAITDAGLQMLGGVASLEAISVGGSAATPDGVARLKRRLPKADVIEVHVSQREEDEIEELMSQQEGRTDNVISSPKQAIVALKRANAQMRARLWRQALETLGKIGTAYLQSVAGLKHLGRCHAELGRWQDAEDEYFEAFEKIPQEKRPVAQWLWEELDGWPQLFEHVAQTRPDDIGRWIASARCAVLEGRWHAAAADYARAKESPSSNGIAPSDPDLEFEFGLSRLLEGDVAEYRHVSTRLINAKRKSLERNRESSGSFYGPWGRVSHLWLMAPQGVFGASQVKDWSRDEAASSSEPTGLKSLLYLRAAAYQKVLEQALPLGRTSGEEYLGRYWFSRAMAHQHLRQSARARECFTRGAQWLERRMRFARYRSRYDDARYILEAEVLRREAERLLFE